LLYKIQSKKDLVFYLFFVWIYSDDLNNFVELTLKQNLSEQKEKNKFKVFFLRFKKTFEVWTEWGPHISPNSPPLASFG
jgi:hypothetical protein